MICASDLHHLSQSLCFWQVYDPTVKADLFATAVQANGTLFVIDPVPLTPEAQAELLSGSQDRAVLLTNANHLRAAPAYAKNLGATIIGAPEAIVEVETTASTRALGDGEKLTSEVMAIAIPGAAPGEMAFHFAAEGGTLVLGDALINFEPYGFTFLPPKYCSNQKAMKKSLQRLREFAFQRMLFAHGTPILASAQARLEALLS